MKISFIKISIIYPSMCINVKTFITDIVVTNGSLESVPHPDPKWLAIEGAEDCLTKMKMGDSTPVCVHLIQSEFCKNDAWKQLRKLVEAKELKQCYGSGMIFHSQYS